MARLIRLAMALSLVLVAHSARATCQPIAVVNAGFEDPVLSDDSFTVNVVPGWTVESPGAGVFNPTTASYPAEAPEGQNVLYLSASSSAVSQVLTAVLEPDQRYTLSVSIGDRLELAFRSYAVELRAGSQLLATDLFTFAGDGVPNGIPADGSFATSTVQFTALPTHPMLGEPLEIRIRAGGGSASSQVHFDDVQLCASDLGTSSIESYGRAVLAHDTNTLATDCSGTVVPEIYATNVAEWLTENAAGSSVLAVELEPATTRHDFSVPVRQALQSAGFAVTYESDRSVLAQLTVSDLQAYDAVFVGVVFNPARIWESSTIPGHVLSEYLRSGGNVYVYGGGVYNPEVEAAHLNSFVTNLGVAYDPLTYNGINSVLIDSSHPIFAGVVGQQLCNGNGQSLIDLGGTAMILQTANGTENVYAAFSPPALVPGLAPCAGAVLAWVLGWIGLSRRTRRSS